MRKELYKLILVFIMISFSFALAFFIGREITLAGQKNKLQKSSTTFSPTEINRSFSFKKEDIRQPEQSQNIEPVPTPQTTSNQPQTTPTSNMAKENTQKPATETQPTTHQAPNQNPPMNAETKSKKDSVIYGLSIASYQNKNQAMDKATQIKLRFPQWRIFVKRSSRVYTVYIGPFQKKELVQRFLQEIENQKDFPSMRIEKIIIKKSKNKIQSSE